MDNHDITSGFKLLLSSENRLRQSSHRDRIRLLNHLEKELLSHKDALFAALNADFGKPQFESNYIELYLSLAEIRHAKKHLSSWMTPSKVPGQLSIFGSKAWTIPEAKGVSLIISPWNFPVLLALAPLASAIAAGCPVAIKPSEQTPACSRFIKDLIASCFESSEVQVFEGDAEVAKSLLNHEFRHIFFTGSTPVGKLVMQAAAANLSSVTLELGGKSPVIVSGNVNLKDASRRIIFGKWLNAGQTCIAPDYVLVDENLHDALILELKKNADEIYRELNESEYTSIVNENHWKRLSEIVSEISANSGEMLYSAADVPEHRKFGLKIISGANDDSRLMQEELFGPVLAIKKIKNLDEAIRYINGRPTPLSLYLFSKSREIQKRILNEVAAGSVGINDVLGQFYNNNMGFGGLHASGMGKSHGFEGFKAFSHQKSVLKRTWPFNWMELAYPPYTGFKKKIANIVVRFL